MSLAWWQVFSRLSSLHAGRTSRRRASVAPKVEALEDRQLLAILMVTNTADSGPGSLRQALLDTPAGGTVDFRPGLTGTITLTSGELAINKNLTIAGPGAEVVTVLGTQRPSRSSIHSSVRRRFGRLAGRPGRDKGAIF